MADSAAAQLAAIAKTYRTTKGAEELSGIQASLQTLKDKALVVAKKGGIYLEVYSINDKPLYDAIVTVQGQKYLTANGFTVSPAHAGSSPMVYIYWDTQDTLAAEAASL